MAQSGGLLRSSIPNQITVARLASVPLLMFLILWDSPVGRVVGVVLFFLAAMSDAVDGYLARSFKQTSVFGKFADPMADKLLVVSALVCLLQLGELNAVWVMIIIAREFLVTGLRILAISDGQVIPASLLGKLKTVSHVILVLAILVDRSFTVGAWIGIARDAALALALALTVISGVEYFVRCRRLFA
ncbi:MAG: CDP-diacylglycerol--glycerol-3-phosphate 3-phosphatidyltransferase [Candidatus Bipolaricaulota bacterium]|nr:CDP-diacylglycerol--glycerol-3-phosphate 3-phosphatidyltransferase [Candidatus Bipolaricaulota bacterium]